jgi:hypothetical protein
MTIGPQILKTVPVKRQTCTLLWMPISLRILTPRVPGWITLLTRDNSTSQPEQSIRATLRILTPWVPRWSTLTTRDNSTPRAEQSIRATLRITLTSVSVLTIPPQSFPQSRIVSRRTVVAGKLSGHPQKASGSLHLAERLPVGPH